MTTPDLYTSYWNRPGLGKLDARMVAISRGVPRWPLPFRYRKLMELAPTREEFALPGDEFDKAYLSRMDAMGVYAILGSLEEVSGGRPVVMLCHENVLKGETCHRRLLAEFIEERAGIEVPELERGMLDNLPTQGRLW